MKLRVLLAELVRLDVHLVVTSGGRLQVVAPMGVLSAALSDEVRRRREQLKAIAGPSGPSWEGFPVGEPAILAQVRALLTQE
jgi:hypothetical protein